MEFRDERLEPSRENTLKDSCNDSCKESEDPERIAMLTDYIFDSASACPPSELNDDMLVLFSGITADFQRLYEMMVSIREENRRMNSIPGQDLIKESSTTPPDSDARDGAVAEPTTVDTWVADPTTEDAEAGSSEHETEPNIWRGRSAMGGKISMESLLTSRREVINHVVDDSSGNDRMGWFANLSPTVLLKALIELLPPFVILVNATTLGLSSEVCVNCTIWTELEVTFTVFYMIEWICKLYLLTCRGYFLGASWYWNWFDFFVLWLGVFEMCLTLGLENIAGYSDSLQDLVVIKILRMSRLMRLIRALKFGAFKELKQMIMGIFNGLSVLFWAVVLLLVLIYVLAVFMRNLAEGKDELPEFSTLPSAMFSLFRCFTDGCSSYEGRPLAEHLRRAFGGPFMVCYIVVMMLVTIGIFNMIMAVFINNAIASAFRRRQKELSEMSRTTETRIKLMVAQLATNPVVFDQHVLLSQKITWRGIVHFVRSLQARADRSTDEVEVSIAHFDALTDAGLVISREEFDSWLKFPQFVDLLEGADIDTSNLSELFDALDSDMSDWLKPEEIVSGLMKLRGPVSKNDVIATRMKVRYLTSLTTKREQEAGRKFSHDNEDNAKQSDAK
eukprot:TRINITY_DN106047_c0_g1_i1.p1 TRINITY_DN106047_c0_g1~~TRINITY_DN106047_c0_g1_i1.p1  ORF type:complete len:618 (+),score=107.32 TRINITY_DN106047_c0_g1_i1:27-1880(+)